MHPETSLRAFLRRFAVAFVVVTLIATAVVAAANVIENNKFSSIHRIKLPDNVLAPGEAGAPANYLIVGSDSRKFVDNPAERQAFGGNDHAGLSDVMMVVHLVPAQGSAFVVSFPRDTEVAIPGHGTNLLNAAYAFGGPALLIKTFKEEFGIPIQHYLAVDFLGFEKVVDAIGHVKIYFPTAARDFATGLYQGPGCNPLGGEQALAYARSRHYSIPAEGVAHPDPNNRDDWVDDPRQDLDRIRRQQYFLRSLGQTALEHGASNPFVANRLADAVVKSLTGDTGLSNRDIKSLVRTFRGLDPTTVEMTTLPVSSPDNVHLQPEFPEATSVLDRLKDLSSPVRLPQLADPADVRVVVVDGSGTDGRAAELQHKLRERGFVDGGAGDASVSNFPKTQVRYAPGHAVEGLTVALYLGTSNVVEATSTTLQFGSQKLAGDVIVVTGRDYPDLRGLLARPSSSSSTSTPAAKGSTSTSTTSTTIAVPDTRYVPVATKGLEPLVGCP